MYFATDFPGVRISFSDREQQNGMAQWFTQTALGGVVNEEEVWEEYSGLTEKSKLQTMVANMNKCEKEGGYPLWF